MKSISRLSLTPAFLRRLRKFALITVCSSAALGLALVYSPWRPARAAVPGTEGSGIVDPATGTYSDSIKIDVPDYYDLEPNIKLIYGSNKDNDFTGMGWSITGESFFERVSPGGGSPAYTSSDTYVFDGSTLLPNTSLGGTHVTKQQSYLRIKQDAANDKWYVWGKDGTMKTYTPLYRVVYGGVWYTFRWALSTVQDTNGHTVTYNYWTDPSQNCYLNYITYNGYTIKFWREARPDSISFANGAYVGHTNYRLKTIEVKVGASEAGAYKLSYTTSASTQCSLLASVQEFGTDVTLDSTGTVTGGTAIPAKTMSYYNPGTAGFPTQASNVRVGGWDTTWKDNFVDVNGDGKPDLVRLWNNGGTTYAQVSLSNGTGYPTITSNSNVGGWNTSYRYLFTDVNGDGRADLIVLWNSSGKTQARVYLSNGSGYPTMTSQYAVGGWNTAYSYQTADVNGDGKSDLVTIWNNGGNTWAQVNLSNGSGYPTIASNAKIGGWDTTWEYNFADVNGDGKDDLVVIWNNGGRAWAQISPSNGTGFPTQIWNGDVGGWNPAKIKDNVVDVNGDGKADIVRIWNNNGTAYAQVNLSTGNGMAAASWNGGIGGWADTNQYYLVDVNGDGNPDIVTIWNNGGNTWAQVRLFNGVGFPANASWNANVGGWNTAWKYQFGDVNGDGKQDLIVAWNNSGEYIQVNPASGGTTPPDLLTSMTNGVGGSVAISYTPSSVWPSQYVPRGGLFPTVASVTVADGRGNSGVTTYSYADAKYSIADKAFLGFGFEEVVYDDQGSYLETYNRQTVQSFGQPDSVTGKNNAGAIYSRTTYSYTEGGNGTTTPYTSVCAQKNEFDYNLAATARQSRSSYTYDSYGNLTQMVDEGDIAITGDELTKAATYNYNTASYIVDTEQSEQLYSGTSVVAANKVADTLYYYDGASSITTLPTNGNLTRTDAWNKQAGTYSSISCQYDAYGNKVSVTDARGATGTTVFDSVYHQFPVQNTDPLGHSSSLVWDYVKGVITSTTDENGATTTIAYDVLGRTVSATNPAGQVTETFYYNTGDPNNQCIYTKVPDGTADGLWSYTNTDGLGRAYKTVRKGPSAGVTYIKETVYNDACSFPQKSSLWYQSGGTPVWETYIHDGAGRLTKETHADGSYATLTYAMDANNKPYTIAVDELGHERAVWVDTDGKITQVREKNGSAYYYTTCTYDAVGHLLQTKDNSGTLTSYTYDTLGRVLSVIDPNLGTITKTYDAGGLLLSETDAKGQTTNCTYDLLGRLKTKTVGGQTTTWYYDEAGYGASIGRLTRVAYPAGSESSTYNNLGQVTSATQTIGAVTKALATTYDSVGRPQTLTYPDGEVVTYTYDAAGNLYSLSGYVNAMIYGANGELTQLTYANGTTSNYTYDPNRLWLNTATVQSGTTTLYTGSYTYNALQLVTSMTQGTPTAQTTNYTYDDLNRLLSVSGAQTQSFTYDTIGNMTSNSLKGAYTYGDAAHKHAVTAAGSSTYTYDANGDMLTGNGKTMVWDASGRLASVSAGSATTTFAYGAGDNRIQKTQGANTTLYFSGMLEQVNGSPVQYYYAGGILVAKKDAAGTKTWYHSDRLGSTRLMTNASGAEVRDYDYRPFGDVLTQSGTMANERGFTGQILDAETGLMYYNARYYDASLGRFISADSMSSVANPQDLNAYSYCCNNPINSTDPTGHYAMWTGSDHWVTWTMDIVHKTHYKWVYHARYYWVAGADTSHSVTKVMRCPDGSLRPYTTWVYSRAPATRVCVGGYYSHDPYIVTYVNWTKHDHYRPHYKDVSGSNYMSVNEAAHTAIAKDIAKAARAHSIGGRIGGWWGHNWKTVAVIAAVVVVVGVTGGLAAPAGVGFFAGAGSALMGAGDGVLASRAIAGGISMAATGVTDWRSGRSLGYTVNDSALQGVLGFASAGIGQGMVKFTNISVLKRTGMILAASAAKDYGNNWAAGNSVTTSVINTVTGAGCGAALNGIAASKYFGGGFNYAKAPTYVEGKTTPGAWDNPVMSGVGGSIGTAWGVTMRAAFH